MGKYLVGMCKRSQDEGHTCDACKLTESFNSLQKTHKKNERKLERKKRKERRKTGFEGRSCFKCFLHKSKLVEQSGTHQRNCPYKKWCKDDKSGFCDKCAIHEQFKKVQKKFCMMRREQRKDLNTNSSPRSTDSISTEPESFSPQSEQEIVLDEGQVEVSSYSKCF
jgi:hypothetical protein